MVNKIYGQKPILIGSATKIDYLVLKIASCLGFGGRGVIYFCNN
jgi:hypothetical protein